MLQKSLTTTVILIPDLCPEIILHTGQVIVLIISEPNPVPVGSWFSLTFS